MKVRVPMMVQDPFMAGAAGQRIIEGFDITGEEFFLDGPVVERVAILDFDPATGQLNRGAHFLPATGNDKLGRYAIMDEQSIRAPDFMQVSTFATVLKTIYLFEHERALGRRLSWAFGAPQLFIVPRAGKWANAFYERESHSLQFFFFPSPKDETQMIYTCLSRDIVAHETGHAVVDAIVPDLYNAMSPQSLALHEAVADLTAMLMAFGSGTLSHAVLKPPAGSIADPNPFSSIAEELGNAMYPDRGGRGLRSLVNAKTLDPASPEYVAEDEPHALSEVLSGALYTVMVKIHDDLKDRYARERGTSVFSASGRSLAVAADRFRRLIARALDYLPPGEISFADYGRAIIAAEQIAYPDRTQERNWVTAEFVRRHIVPNANALHVDIDYEYPPLREIDLNVLVESDWVAYVFANQHREFLGIPPNVNLRVRPRLQVTKSRYVGDQRQAGTECLFKVSWDHEEPNHLGSAYPRQRQITLGTTLVIDWDTKRVLAMLTSRPKEQRDGRDLLLRRLINEDMLRMGHRAMGPDGRWLRGAIRAETMRGLMRIRATARMLHITQPGKQSQTEGG